VLHRRQYQLKDFRVPCNAAQHTMRLIARFVVLMVAVFGVSLAFAWAWDRSDSPPAAQVHGS
jgi:cell division septal protein FtsQ